MPDTVETVRQAVIDNTEHILVSLTFCLWMVPTFIILLFGDWSSLPPLGFALSYVVSTAAPRPLNFGAWFLNHPISTRAVVAFHIYLAGAMSMDHDAYWIDFLLWGFVALNLKTTHPDVMSRQSTHKIVPATNSRLSRVIGLSSDAGIAPLQQTWSTMAGLVAVMCFDRVLFLGLEALRLLAKWQESIDGLEGHERHTNSAITAALYLVSIVTAFRVLKSDIATHATHAPQYSATLLSLNYVTTVTVGLQCIVQGTYYNALDANPQICLIALGGCVTFLVGFSRVLSTKVVGGEIRRRVRKSITKRVLALLHPETNRRTIYEDVVGKVKSSFLCATLVESASNHVELCELGAADFFVVHGVPFGSSTSNEVSDQTLKAINRFAHDYKQRHRHEPRFFFSSSSNLIHTNSVPTVEELLVFSSACKGALIVLSKSLWENDPAIYQLFAAVSIHFDNVHVEVTDEYQSVFSPDIVTDISNRFAAMAKDDVEDNNVPGAWRPFRNSLLSMLKLIITRCQQQVKHNAVCQTNHPASKVYDETLASTNVFEFATTTKKTHKRQDVYTPKELDRTSICLNDRFLCSNASDNDGDFGKIILAKLKFARETDRSQTEVAVRIIHSNSARRLFLREAFVASQLEHLNICGLIGVCTTGWPQVQSLVVYEHSPSLLSYLESLKQTTNSRSTQEQQLRDCCVGVVDGLRYLTSCKFMLNGFSSHSVAMKRGNVAQVVLTGVALDHLEESEYLVFSRNSNDNDNDNDNDSDSVDSNSKVPIRWAAPEVLSLNSLSEKAMVWSLGVVCWQVFTLGEVPYKNVATSDILTHLLDHGCTLEVTGSSNCSPDFFTKAIQPCLNVHRNPRPSFADIRACLLSVTSSSSCDTSYTNIQPHNVTTNGNTTNHSLASSTPSSVVNTSSTNASIATPYHNGIKIKPDKDNDADATGKTQFDNKDKFIKLHVLSDSDDENGGTTLTSPVSDTNVAISSTATNRIEIAPATMVERDVDVVGGDGGPSLKDVDTTTNTDAYDARHGLGLVVASGKYGVGDAISLSPSTSHTHTTTSNKRKQRLSPRSLPAIPTQRNSPKTVKPGIMSTGNGNAKLKKRSQEKLRLTKLEAMSKSQIDMHASNTGGTAVESEKPQVAVSTMESHKLSSTQPPLISMEDKRHGFGIGKSSNVDSSKRTAAWSTPAKKKVPTRINIKVAAPKGAEEEADFV